MFSRRFNSIFLAGMTLLLSSGLGGCYTYAPTQFRGLETGSEVRARLTQEAALRLEDALGRDATILEGRIVEARESTLVVSVPSGTRQVGFTFQQLNQSVEFTQGETVLLESKQLDRARTVGLAAVAVAAVTALAIKALGDEAGGNTANPPIGGPSDARRVSPGFSITLPWGVR